MSEPDVPDGARHPAPVVTVVVPVRNGGAHLAHQLEALAAQDFDRPWALVVSDNGSTDGTTDLLDRWAGRLPQLRVVDSSARRGSNPARNAAVAASPAADPLLFCDADDVVGPAWMRGLVAALEQWPIVTGPVVLVDAEERVTSRTTSVPRYHGRFPFALGASLGIRRQVFDALGGFADSPPGISASDVELAWRAGQAGYEIGFAPEAEIVKHRREAGRATWDQWFGYGCGDRWIAATHPEAGLARTSARAQVKTLGWLVVHPGELSSAEGRRRWVRWAAHAAGFVVGRRPAPTPVPGAPGPGN
jgi:GT2 family glycosyltransferase